MNIRDNRTVGEQVKSGFRLAVFILLTFALMFVLLPSTKYLVGKDSDPTLSHLLSGATGLAAISVLMFFTARYWAKWFAVFLAWIIIRFIVFAPFTIRIHRWWILELLLSVALFSLAIGPALRPFPLRVETVGLIVAVFSLSFATVLASYLPLFIGVGMLALTRYIAWKSEVEANNLPFDFAD